MKNNKYVLLGLLAVTLSIQNSGGSYIQDFIRGMLLGLGIVLLLVSMKGKKYD